MPPNAAPPAASRVPDIAPCSAATCATQCACVDGKLKASFFAGCSKHWFPRSGDALQPEVRGCGGTARASGWGSRPYGSIA